MKEATGNNSNQPTNTRTLVQALQFPYSLTSRCSHDRYAVGAMFPCDG
ncbi:hypothetical protein SAMN05216299_11963 [Nitrosospira sp. Nsp14]|jgi:hypothetical protein|nr:hypothetical protein SAMN05216299_11963 [Nitrosospira sp. Nsp14]